MSSFFCYFSHELHSHYTLVLSFAINYSTQTLLNWQQKLWAQFVERPAEVMLYLRRRYRLAINPLYSSGSLFWAFISSPSSLLNVHPYYSSLTVVAIKLNNPASSLTMSLHVYVLTQNNLNLSFKKMIWSNLQSMLPPLIQNLRKTTNFLYVVCYHSNCDML